MSEKPAVLCIRMYIVYYCNIRLACNIIITFVPYRAPEHGLHFRGDAVQLGVSGAISVREALERKPGQEIQFGRTAH